ncbi:MAG: hypothetical protein PVG39_28965 [Desulfobacteraceae bacterium]|jgi:YD repeat-containing protein
MTRPGGATEITEVYLDGKTKSITGTGVVSQYFTYGVNIDGTQWVQTNTGSPTSPMWGKITTDMLGRTVSVEKPGHTGIETTENIFDNQGRLIMTITPGQANTLYVYDELGSQIRTGLDIDASGVLETASDLTGGRSLLRRYIPLAMIPQP